MKILFDNEADRMDAYEAVRRDINCGTLTLNMTHNRIYCVPVSAVAVRMDELQPREHWHKRLFTLDVDLMHLKPVEPVEVPDDAAVLRAQLAARDAALDAVLELLSDNSTISESSDTRMFRARCLLRLANNGVHPK